MHSNQCFPLICMARLWQAKVLVYKKEYIYMCINICICVCIYVCSLLRLHRPQWCKYIGADPDQFDVVWLWLTTAFFAVDICFSFVTGFPAGKREIRMGYPPGQLITRKG